MSATTQNPNELGAIWKKESNGKKFYTGKLTVNGQEIQIVMFQNDRKQPGSNAPDWRIYKSTRPEGGNNPPPPQAKAASAPTPNRPAAPKAPARPRPPTSSPVTEEVSGDPADAATASADSTL